jgi:PBSX family phage portal protein
MSIKPLSRRITLPVAKVEPRQQRAARNVRFIQTEAKYHTSGFDGLLSQASGAPVSETVTPEPAKKRASKTPLKSNAAPDPFSYSNAASGDVIAGFGPIVPSYQFNHLARLVQNSNTLRQCIEAYVVNIESYGHMLEYIGEEGSEKAPDVQAEKVMLENFLSLCSPDASLKEIRERTRWDFETIGNRFFEISRDLAGRIIMFDHLPGTTMRRTIREVEQTEVILQVPNPADPSQMIVKTAFQHFCRYVQISYTNHIYHKTYFKEFGDPRSIDPKTGEENPALPIEDQATECLMLSLYTPGQIYGLPRWIGQLPSILGSRESEMVNLNFFRENAIPAMAVLISGGALTQESFEVIDAYINALKGTAAMNRILVLEASGDDTSGSTDHSVSAPRIDMKPMISERQQDGLFKDYDQANQQKIRSSFRLPPIYAGRAEDYTRASAFASVVTAEQQIFGPERQSFDDLMNNKILRTYRPRYWRFKSVGVPLADPDSLATMLTTLDSTGALTPNAVIKIANKILDIDIKPVTEAWGDYPWAAVMQYVIAGNQVDGLTEFIVDMEAEAEKAAEAQQNALDVATAGKPDPADPASPQNRGKPGKTNQPGGKNKKKAKSKSKNTAVTKALQSHILQNMVRKEMRSLSQELRHHMDMQVPAR